MPHFALYVYYPLPRNKKHVSPEDFWIHALIRVLKSFKCCFNLLYCGYYINSFPDSAYFALHQFIQLFSTFSEFFNHHFLWYNITLHPETICSAILLLCFKSHVTIKSAVIYTFVYMRNTTCDLAVSNVWYGLVNF